MAKKKPILVLTQAVSAITSTPLNFNGKPLKVIKK
jgi:hypothetical protein